MLELSGITANKNTCPGDKSALVPGGLRLGESLRNLALTIIQRCKIKSSINHRQTTIVGFPNFNG